MRLVLRVDVHDGDFAFWPVAETKSFGHIPLGDELSPTEVGTAMMRIVGCNDVGPDPGEGFPLPPADPLGYFLHGMLTSEEPIVGGGLLVVDTSTGIVVPPGCCCGLEDWREWQEVVDGGDPPWLGHDPEPTAERLGDTVRLTLDSGKSDGPVNSADSWRASIVTSPTSSPWRPTGHPTTCPSTPPLWWPPPSPACWLYRRRPGRSNGRASSRFRRPGKWADGTGPP
ncbi:hypothetical protein [Streptomyces sp. SID3343]|uniref:hypothetical protein n=1 Tax=Streptomyces sp. SID3343 TaxID=2690260 RepID=UPI001F1D4314|nr:hypothetical protein [Streptomyces sp. SID3343]